MPRSTVGSGQSSLAAKVDAGLVPASGQASEPKMISSAFYNVHPSVATAKVSARRNTRPASIGKAEAAIPRETLVVFQSVVFQSTQYDATGAPVWTLCVWTVRDRNSGDRQIESAIVMDSI
jgi:hypothetical protein